MFFRNIIAATTLLLASARAQASPAAIVVIEASHGGAGQDLTNTTVTIPLTSTYVNHTALDAVSTLYLIDSRNSPLDGITCTPFKHADGTGKAGLAFNDGKPSFLSTNTVQVGSIVCISTSISMAPPGGPGGMSLSAPASSSSMTKTRTKSANSHMSTQTHTAGTQTTATAGGQGQQTGTASSSSATPTNTDNAASTHQLSGQLFGGLALAGFGIAFAL